MVDIIEIIEELQKLRISTENPKLSFDTIINIEDNELKSKLLDFIAIIFKLESGFCPDDFNFKDKEYVKELENICKLENDNDCSECFECWLNAIRREKLLLKENK